MKQLLTIGLCTVFILNLCLLTPTASGQTDEALTNEMILKMATDGLSGDIIIAKISGSSTRFDTSPEAMGTLKQSGVPDAVILAMVQSTGSPKPAAPRAPPIDAMPISSKKSAMVWDSKLSWLETRRARR